MLSHLYGVGEVKWKSYNMQHLQICRKTANKLSIQLALPLRNVTPKCENQSEKKKKKTSAGGKRFSGTQI